MTQREAIARPVPGIAAVLAAAATLAGMVALHAAPASAQTEGSYPHRAIRIVVPFGAGTQSDSATRLVAEKLSESLRQPVVVENHPGASANIGSEIVARAPPDGYTLLSTGSLITLLPVVMGATAVDPVAAFAPVAKLAEPPMVVVVHPTLGVSSLAELRALARTKPGRIAYATAGVGSVQHLTASIFARKAGIELLHVPYANSGLALKDVMSGEIPVYFTFLGPINAQLRAGQLKAIAVASQRRIASWPDIPTVVEQGYPEAAASPWNGIVAPAGTPRAIVLQLNREFARIVALPEVRERFAQMGLEPISIEPDQFALEIREATARWPAVARDAGVAAK